MDKPWIELVSVSAVVIVVVIVGTTVAVVVVAALIEVDSLVNVACAVVAVRRLRWPVLLLWVRLIELMLGQLRSAGIGQIQIEELSLVPYILQLVFVLDFDMLAHKLRTCVGGWKQLVGKLNLKH